MAQEMKIKVVAVEVANAKTKTNKDYQFLEVTYKNISFDNKTESKKIMPFGSKEVFNTLKVAENGDVFTLLREKDNDGYWQWVGIAAGDVAIEQTTTQASSGGAAAPAKAATPQAAKSTFETPEERAKKQVYIVRQSSISAAIDTLKTDKKAPSKEEVVELAKYYESYVFGQLETVAVANPVKVNDFDPDDDIPM